MKRWGMVCILIAVIQSLYAQYDVPASFPGGDEAYNAYLQSNLVFPKQAIAAKMTREIRAVVTIDTLGKVEVQSFVYPSSNMGFEESVTSFINNMPNWSPAVHDGEVANSQTVLTFNFTYIDPELDYDTHKYTYYTDSEVPPTFVGGLDSILSFVQTMLVDTFEFSFDTTTVTVQFVVGKDSSIIDAQVITSDNQIPDDYWVYVIRSLPNSIPGRIRNKRVNVQSTLSLVVVSEEAGED